MQVKRNQVMQRRLQRYDVVRWVDDFLELLKQAKQGQESLDATRITKEIREQMIQHYRRSNRRLLLLDYDGTLVPFSRDPDKAIPSQTLLKLMSQIVCNKCYFPGFNSEGFTFEITTTPNEKQRQAYALLEKISL